jgi:hypothetical protein
MAARQALVSGGAFDQASHALCAFLRKLVLHGAPKPGAKTKDAERTAEAVNVSSEAL